MNWSDFKIVANFVSFFSHLSSHAAIQSSVYADNLTGKDIFFHPIQLLSA